MSVTKIFAKSVTLWGLAITTVTAVVPAVGSMFGLEVSPAEIIQFGEHGTNVINAVGSMVGFAMILYGRWRAKEPLSVN